VVHPTVWRLADKRLLALTALKKTARKQFPLAEGLLPLACFCATSSVEQGSWASTYVQVGLMWFSTDWAAACWQAVETAERGMRNEN
jgi:hypothetical protein